MLLHIKRDRLGNGPWWYHLAILALGVYALGSIFW